MTGERVAQLNELIGEVVKLADFIVDGNEESGKSGALGEAVMALESLGFKRDAIQKALAGSSSGDTSTLVKEGLKKLQRL